MSLLLLGPSQVARAAAEQALSWAESDDTGATKGGLKIVVVENMFHPSDFEVRGRLDYLEERIFPCFFYALNVLGFEISRQKVP